MIRLLTVLLHCYSVRSRHVDFIETGAGKRCQAHLAEGEGQGQTDKEILAVALQCIAFVICITLTEAAGTGKQPRHLNFTITILPFDY